MHRTMVSGENGVCRNEADLLLAGNMALPLRYASLPLGKRLNRLGLRLALASRCPPEVEEQVMWVVNGAMLKGELRYRRPEIMVTTFLQLLYEYQVSRAMPLRAAVRAAVKRFMAENGGLPVL
ncbi:hypothetical protein [Pantoea sp.]|uniref:hypothetical protein n=1 Tax=Pantoea sp. TaxID=69393 RepID=UPI0028A6D785|nr:hypothetical protein [Pantoea sp.]